MRRTITYAAVAAVLSVFLILTAWSLISDGSSETSPEPGSVVPQPEPEIERRNQPPLSPPRVPSTVAEGSAPPQAAEVGSDLGSTAPVRGVLISPDGEGVEGEQVTLTSRAAGVTLTSISDEKGAFEFPGVPLGHDYRLWLRPRHSYRNVVLRSLLVESGGLDLEIGLEALGFGRVSGQVVDVDGQPVPDLELVVRSTQELSQTISVRADKEGRFEVKKIPEGDLIFTLGSSPGLTVRGVRAHAGKKTRARLITDHGTHRIVGQVTDLKGNPIAGAHVDLTWRYRTPSLRCHSNRRAETDETGEFDFSGLGRGPHELRVTAEDFLPSETLYTSGDEELLIRLEAAP